ncbi:FAD:protein FMN transferase [Shimia sp. MIT1388]|uniref:FAD:protein FMN transferase n=1 Tax=Shimia sp. MIT1388 TaxID=3096992 RepID=UPI00399C467A
MTVTRRRFLAIAAAFAGSPAFAQRHSWQGFALGAEVNITLTGPTELARPILERALELIKDVEAAFSLYDPASALSQLNKTKQLKPSEQFYTLMTLADAAHRATDGLFDPTVQPLWQALAEGSTTDKDRQAIGWERVAFTPSLISLQPEQALTFNGIAQGFATDLVAELLDANRFDTALINIGEYRSTGGAWRLGLKNAQHGLLGQRTLTHGAIATSDTGASPLGARGHILHPTALPKWSSVTVEADTAAWADALSTALTLAPLDQVQAITAAADLRRVTLVSFDGELTTL